MRALLRRALGHMQWARQHLPPTVHGGPAAKTASQQTPNPSLQTAEGRHWAPGLSKFWTFAKRSFPPLKLLGLANTRISTGYAQRYPQSLVTRFNSGLGGASTGSTTGRPSRYGLPGPAVTPSMLVAGGKWRGTIADVLRVHLPVPQNLEVYLFISIKLGETTPIPYYFFVSQTSTKQALYTHIIPGGHWQKS